MFCFIDVCVNNAAVLDDFRRDYERKINDGLDEYSDLESEWGVFINSVNDMSVSFRAIYLPEEKLLELSKKYRNEEILVSLHDDNGWGYEEYRFFNGNTELIDSGSWSDSW